MALPRDFGERIQRFAGLQRVHRIFHNRWNDQILTQCPGPQQNHSPCSD